MRPSEHKTVQARIRAYAQEIGWTYVSRAEAEARRGFTPYPTPLPQGARELRAGEEVKERRRGEAATVFYLPRPRWERAGVRVEPEGCHG
jgi:hypothetical protein